MRYLGNIAEDATIDFKFTTHDDTGLPATLAGTPALSVYKANGTTESTAGITLTADFDSRTGLNHVRIDTSADAFYATGNDYQVVITTGTVDSVSVVGYVVAEFSIENRYTGVADGLAAYDPPTKAELDSAVAPLALEATAQSILTDTSTTLQAELDGIQADTEDIQSRLPAALVSGRIDASVGAMAANTLTASALAADAVTEIQAGLSTLDAAGVRTAVGLASANLDTQLLAIDTVADAVAAVTDKLDDTLEDDGGTYRFTANALEEAPSGGGLDAAGVRAAVGLASANLDTQLADIPTVSEFNARTIASADYATASALATVDTEVGDILVDTGTTLPAQIAALSLGSGDGGNATWTYEVKQTDGTPVNDATVTLCDTVTEDPYYIALTNVSGIATFNPDPNTYLVKVTKNGFTPSQETVVVPA